MAVRGRPASELPQRAVEHATESVGLPVPGDGDDRTNRLTGLGSLSGLATGVVIGIGFGLLRPFVSRLPSGLAAGLVGAAAMAATDASMTVAGLTNPAQWSPTDWLSDAVPHLAYGAVTAGTLRALG